MDMSRHDLRAGANDLPGSVVLTVHHVLVVAVLLLVRLRSGSGLHGKHDDGCPGGCSPTGHARCLL